MCGSQSTGGASANFFSRRPPPYLFEHKFPPPPVPRPLLPARDVPVAVPPLGEGPLQRGWEELAWFEDEGLRSEWFREAAPSATRSQLPRARAPFKPATPAGRLALEARAAAELASRPPVCSGARGARAARDAGGPPT